MDGLRKLLRQLPSKKPYIEVLTAVLTVPVLLTVIILNLNNLNGKGKKPEPKPTEKIIIQAPTLKTEKVPTPQPTVQSCRKTIGPVIIESPKEDETISSNPVCVSIKYLDQNFCSVVWSYRINNGAWSDYNSNSPCIYNLPQGKVKFELRVQSTVSQDQGTLKRNFSYEGTELIATPSPTTSPN